MRAEAAAPAKVVRYLERAQNTDGGMGPAPGARSTQIHTAWAALGLAAAGRNPRTVSRGGRDMVDYIRAHASELRGDPGERSRTILALRAAGAAPGRLGGRNLVAELLRSQERNGSFAGRVNTTAFAVLALRAAGRRPGDRAVRRAAAFLLRQANRDGGYNFAGRGGPSGADDTGSALQGLAAAGKRRDAGGPARGGLARPPSERRRRLLAPGRGEQRAVDRVGRPGPDRRGPQPGAPAPPRRALAAGLPALADRLERRRPLLAHERPDPRVGHGAGPDRARRQGAADRSGAALTPANGAGDLRLG